MANSRSRVTKILLALPMLSLASTVPPGFGGLSAIDEANPTKTPTGRDAAFVPRISALPAVEEPFPMSAFDRMRARLVNAAIPFASSRGPAARPFAFNGGADMRQRAVDCLASAMWYEAGDDARGQRAVAQVVLNRVRHPAFPKSICGVIFQGAERKTGCQFTFTCDGALARTPSPAQFAAARAEASAMLSGSVDREVGLATHYHTDWVAPVWSPSMDKIARVESHLFFRWHGKAGGPVAMRGAYAGREPAIPLLARISPTHRLAVQPESAASEAPPEEGAPAALALPIVNGAPASPNLTGSHPPILPVPPSPKPAEGVFQLQVEPTGNGAAQAMAALKLCGDRAFCKVIGRLGADASGVAFLYIRDRRTGVDRAFWNCQTYRRADAGQCLSAGNRRWIDFDGNLYSGKGG
jgi:hypothetical protein